MTPWEFWAGNFKISPYCENAICQTIMAKLLSLSSPAKFHWSMATSNPESYQQKVTKTLAKFWPSFAITVSFYRKNVSLGLLVCSKCRCRFIIHKEHYSTKTLRMDGKRLENGEKYVGIPLLEGMREIKLV